MAQGDPKDGLMYASVPQHHASISDGMRALPDQQLVVQEEQHPSAMGIGQPKEGFSVFGIFNQCVSPMGRRLLRLWFRRPIINLTAIQDRQVSPPRWPSPDKGVSNARNRS